MPRTYAKKLGGRPYLNYNKENEEKVIKAVSKSKAWQKCKVPSTTLIDKICENHPLKPRRPCVLTVEEEQPHCVEVTPQSGVTSTPKTETKKGKGGCGQNVFNE